MKHLALLSFLSTLLLSIPSKASASNDAVVDVDGNELLPGVKYYVLPISHGLGGGLSTSSHGNVPCPLHVRQKSLDVERGSLVTFTPVDSGDKVVRLSTDLNVRFTRLITICIQSLVWTLGDADEVTGRQYVLTNGTTGNPGVETVSNWFKIERHGVHGETAYNYKLVFCPTVCDFCKPLCGDLGVFNEDGVWWLGFDGTEFPVVFKRREE